MSVEERAREYSPSVAARHFEETLIRYGTESRRVEAMLPPAARMAYGDAPDEYALLLAGRRNAPLVIFFHGGYWQEGSAEDSLFPAENLLSRGIAYAAVSYSLAPKLKLDEIVGQCQRATERLCAIHKARNPGARVILAGSSAGAHLVASMLVADWTASGSGACPFDGAMLLSGVFDLRPLVGTYINDAVQLDKETAPLLSPVLSARSIPVPVSVCWGELETDEFKRQSLEMAQELRSQQQLMEAFEVADRDHFDLVFDLGAPQTSLGKALSRHLKELS